jgi:hypothetical protein
MDGLGLIGREDVDADAALVANTRSLTSDHSVPFTVGTLLPRPARCPPPACRLRIIQPPLRSGYRTTADLLEPPAF